MAIDAHEVNFTKIQITCPESLGVDAEVRRVAYYVHHHYQCQKQCQDGEYTYEASTILLQGKSNKDNPNDLRDKQLKPVCTPCPVGAK